MASTCFHCNDPISTSVVLYQEHDFCCNGCKSVYQLLNSDDFQSVICDLELFEKKQSIQFLDVLKSPEIARHFITYQDKEIQLIQFHIPSIHCASCIWLFEKLPEILDGVMDVKVNYFEKTIHVKVQTKNTDIHSLAIFLKKLGYEPDLNIEKNKKKNSQRSEILKLGIAGFCFGNIMLFSLPEYFHFNDVPKEFNYYFSVISVLLSIPVLLFSGKDYFINAFRSYKFKKIDLNTPISLGISSLFLFSLFDIFINKNSGYLDSLSGLIFFLLIGQFFQNKIFNKFSRERSMKSFFPLAVQTIKDGEWKITPVDELEVGDVIQIRNKEIIPTDCILKEGTASLDNSFITGETDLHNCISGSLIYAGGKQNGSSILLEVVKVFEQGAWNQKWNGGEEESQVEKIIDKVGYHFTWGVISIAIIGFCIWLPIGWYPAIKAFSTILIVACPCALALATPLTYGKLIRLLASKGLYVKNTSVFGKMKNIRNLVFDKTGTLTESSPSILKHQLSKLSDNQKQLIASSTHHSGHPYSQVIFQSLELSKKLLNPNSINEITGKGLKSIIGEDEILIGTSSWVYEELNLRCLPTEILTIAINSKIVLELDLKQQIRAGVAEALDELNKEYDLSIISGDSYQHVLEFSEQVPKNILIKGQYSPEEKVEFLNRKEGDSLMIGDGLNDAGALKKAKIGFSVNENNHAYFPECDALLNGGNVKDLPDLIRVINWSQTVISICVSLSLVYNIVGIYFAIQLQLSPLIAAVLMPISSLSILLVSQFLMQFKGGIARLS